MALLSLGPVGWEDGIFFRVLPPTFALCLLTRGESLCLSPTCSVDRQEP